jgi:general stress protein YciG
MAENERRGFAGMNQEKQREIARKGGRAAHEKGTAHEFTREEAREAGRKGGEAVSRDREHMSRIGREGGLSSRGGQGRGDRSRVQVRANSEEQDDQSETEQAREQAGGR